MKSVSDDPRVWSYRVQAAPQDFCSDRGGLDGSVVQRNLDGSVVQYFSWPTVISSIRFRWYEFIWGALGSGAISVRAVKRGRGCKFSLTHSGTITALKSSCTEIPLFLARVDIVRKVSSATESMILFIV